MSLQSENLDIYGKYETGRDVLLENFTAKNQPKPLRTAKSLNFSRQPVIPGSVNLPGIVLWALKDCPKISAALISSRVYCHCAGHDLSHSKTI